MKKQLSDILIGMHCNLDYVNWLLSSGGGRDKTELIKSYVLDPAYEQMIESGIIQDNIDGKLRLIEEFKKVCK